jgi:hypothetical protein
MIVSILAAFLAAITRLHTLDVSGGPTGIVTHVAPAPTAASTSRVSGGLRTSDVSGGPTGAPLL